MSDVDLELVYHEDELIELSGLTIQEAISELEKVKDKYPEDAEIWISADTCGADYCYGSVHYEINYEREETREQAEKRLEKESLDTRMESFHSDLWQEFPLMAPHIGLQSLKRFYKERLLSDKTLDKIEEMLHKWGLQEEFEVWKD